MGITSSSYLCCRLNLAGDRPGICRHRLLTSPWLVILRSGKCVTHSNIVTFLNPVPSQMSHYPSYPRNRLSQHLHHQKPPNQRRWQNASPLPHRQPVSPPRRLSSHLSSHRPEEILSGPLLTMTHTHSMMTTVRFS